MSFKDEIKVKDYFMKSYSEQEILNTFNFIIRRMGKTGEIEGKFESAKITRN